MGVRKLPFALAEWDGTHDARAIEKFDIMCEVVKEELEREGAENETPQARAEYVQRRLLEEGFNCDEAAQEARKFETELRRLSSLRQLSSA